MTARSRVRTSPGAILLSPWARVYPAKNGYRLVKIITAVTNCTVELNDEQACNWDRVTVGSGVNTKHSTTHLPTTLTGASCSSLLNAFSSLASVFSNTPTWLAIPAAWTASVPKAYAHKTHTYANLYTIFMINCAYWESIALNPDCTSTRRLHTHQKIRDTYFV
jgi:hypothetical protein